MTKNLSILILTCVLVSCGPRSGINNYSDKPIEKKELLDSNNVKYVENVLSAGHQIFRENCAMCHCLPPAICESGGIEYIFSKVHLDSLPYYERFVKNSIDIRTNEFAPHEYGNVMSDSSIKTVVEYIWLESKPEFRH